MKTAGLEDALFVYWSVAKSEAQVAFSVIDAYTIRIACREDLMTWLTTVRFLDIVSYYMVYTPEEDTVWFQLLQLLRNSMP